MTDPPKPAASKPRIVLFDASALVHRAYHAFAHGRQLTNSKTGEVTSAVFGFTNILLKVLADLKPNCYAIAFDRKGPTFRHDMSPEYKAHRPPTPTELITQLGRVHELVEAFDMPIFEQQGYEADDLLGSVARKAEAAGAEVIIVTGDADAMQLVDDDVKVLYPKPGGTFSDTILYDAMAVTGKFGVPPHRVADYKALVGDPSDNIGGVPGVGPKTAVKLLTEFDGIEEIFRNIELIKPEKLRELLRKEENAARQSLKLATIVTDLPIDFDINKCEICRLNREKAIPLLRELEFTTLINRLPKTDSAGDAVTQATPSQVSQPTIECQYTLVDTTEKLEHLAKSLAKDERFALDTETTSLDALTAELVGLSIAPTAGESYYLPVGHVGVEGAQLELSEVKRMLGPILADKKIPKIAHNAKFDLQIMQTAGFVINGLDFDTMLAAHLLGEKAPGLKNLASTRLHVEMTPITELIGEGKSQICISRCGLKETSDYSCADADMTFRLANNLEPELKKQNQWRLFSEVEMPLVPVIMDMERAGIALDIDKLNEMAVQIARQLVALEDEILALAGHDFNIASPKQLGDVLFGELHLPSGRKTKTGYCTDAAVLDELKDEHAIVRKVLDYRTLAKLKSTYVDVLPTMVSACDGRLHTSFNQARTATGRLSSSDPNLQNIPVRGELGREIRKAFVAPPGYVLLAADYSQIDLRALAHLSGDPDLIAAFKHDEDIHTATAMRLYNLPKEQITPVMRRFAKTINFGVIYGMSDYGLEQATELTRAQSSEFITKYFERYPGVKSYLEATKEQARSRGYVETILGRRRYIPEINASNRQVREAAERMAINMPVQGTSADIIKVAMLHVIREMNRRKLQSRLLLQVHDELIFEVPQHELIFMSEMAPRLMAAAVELAVPLKVDMKYGTNWGEME
ncbi:DNA polymerase I [Dehalogenimonas etheniformans]|uniref:DNA polymerase I n=1 Tax=Dehalogenimonas etheniformans TaxID=1536648 RepID=A0A2P5P5G3_9CHLR|nr:DNA polymerase I [Dehalogenimonas etheniformans]PPD57533.1 DNA polymerase I [Dehalogenimonas etheniformans]QNT76894.1 DNA polymerase I [Dehalogenimonas etheniformans]